MGSPSIYVYDCSHAGIIVELFKQFSLQREQEAEVGRENKQLTRKLPETYTVLSVNVLLRIK